LSDLSLLPLSAFERVKIYDGGFTSLLGQGALGGAIDIDSKWKLENGFQLDGFTNFSSTENLGIAINANLTNRLFKYYANASVVQNENKYKFNYNSEKLTQEHSFNKNVTLIAGMESTLANNNIIDAHLWYQEADREIPDTKISANSNQFQSDHILRGKLGWTKRFGEGDLEFKSAYLRENIVYESDFVPVTQNVFQRIHNEVNYFLNKQNTYYFIGSSFDFDKAKFDAGEDVSRGHFSLFGGLKKVIFKGKGNLSLSSRQSLVENELTPISFSIASDYLMFTNISLSMKVERVFALPTINDQYWPALGNSDLRPEKGWSYDFKVKSNNLNTNRLNWSVGLFGHRINDWILWLPDDNQIWRPQNTRTVVGEGISALLSYVIPIKTSSLKLNANYSFTRSTVREDQNTNSIGKQLVFVPFHKMGSAISFSAKRLEVVYSHSFVGGHYINSDNSLKTEPYHISDLSLLFNFLSKKNYSIDIAVKINNLWNSDYEVVNSYPMPLRYFDLGFHISYN
jgi:iron complex outermembrane receptor protein